MRGFILLAALSAVSMVHTDQYAQIEEQVMDFVQEVEARHDLQGLARQVNMANLAGRVPAPRDFTAFAQEALKSHDPARDTAKDPWGNPYRLEVKRESFHLSSAGPDEDPGSEDDLVVTLVRHPYERF